MFNRQIKKAIIKKLVDRAFKQKEQELVIKEELLNKQEIIVKNNGTRLINEVRTSQELTDKIRELQEEMERCKRVSI